MRPGLAVIALWVLWAASWLLAAGWSNTTLKSPGARAQMAYRVVLIVGTLLFAIPAHGYEGALRLWHVGWMGAWGCVAGIALGIAFAWWARLHLGKLWSGQITKKEDHRVVDSGPYRWVRHPIYTGLLFSVLATMVAKGTILAVVAAGLIVLGVWMKARLEESWLREELGAEAYDNYRRRVPMLIPFGPRLRG